MRTSSTRRASWALVLLLAACKDDENGGGGGGDDGPGGDGTVGDDGTGSGGTAGEGGTQAGTGDETGMPLDPESAVDEARAELPTYLDLHFKVVYRTCTPNEGVCHNDKEYPDLHTPQSMLGAVAKPCNIAVDDPIDTFDGCESPGDLFKFSYGSNADWQSEIAWIELVEGAMGTEAVVHLRDTIPNAMNDEAGTEGFTLSRVYDDGTVQLAELYDAWYEQGTAEVLLRDFWDLGEERQALLTNELVVGDPNRNGVFGADDAAFTLISPGDPPSSYLLGRLLGNVPGTPMPLANQPLSSAEVIALTCWIEGLQDDGALDVYAAIDYDGCDAATNFGAPQPDSGHSLVNDVQPIFDQYCNAGGCHSADMPQSGLDLTAGESRANLLVSSTQDGATYRVVPGNPTSSYLMQKLRGKGATGLQMPRTAYGDGEPLPDETLRILEDWIIAGAPDD